MSDNPDFLDVNLGGAPKPDDPFIAKHAALEAVLSDLGTYSPPAGLQVTLGASNFKPGTPPDEVEKELASRHLALFHDLGVTSWESYVTYAGCSPAEGKWDFSMYDAELDFLERHRLKWVPFLIAGPFYATPEWYRSGPDSLKYKCLEHDEETAIESLWNVAFRPHVEAFLSAFAERYASSGALESVLLGITGDYGEAIYPAGSGAWTGDYHKHQGYWAGDEAARASFRAFCRRKYSDSLSLLNSVWETRYSSFDEIQPFVWEARPNDHAWLDFLVWYRKSLEDYADFWLATARRLFPDTPLYLCTGGNADPRHGSDFTAQCKLAARYKAGIRITNEGSDYSRNFLLTRWVASAGRAYDAFFGFEPAAKVEPEALAARVFNVRTSGACQLFEYSANVTDSPERFAAFANALRKLDLDRPRLRCAAFLPKLAGRLAPDNWWELTHAPYYALRDLLDFDFLDVDLLLDGALKGYDLAFWFAGADVEKIQSDAVIEWLSSGGVLVTRTVETLRLWTSHGAPEPVRLADYTVPVPLLNDTGHALASVYYALSGGVVEVYDPPVPEDFPARLAEVLRIIKRNFPRLARLELPDLAPDELFVSRTDSAFCVLNTSDKPQKRTFDLANGPRELEIPPFDFLVFSEPDLD